MDFLSSLLPLFGCSSSQKSSVNPLLKFVVSALYFAPPPTTHQQVDLTHHVRGGHTRVCVLQSAHDIAVFFGFVCCFSMYFLLLFVMVLCLNIVLMWFDLVGKTSAIHIVLVPPTVGFVPDLRQCCLCCCGVLGRIERLFKVRALFCAC